MGEPTRSPVEESALLAASLDGVGLLEGDTFVDANAELAAVFGREDRGALVGESWTELYPRDERDRIEREVLPQVRAEGRWRGEVTGTRIDGATFSQRLSICAKEDGTGDRSLVWVVRDLDDHGGPGSSSNRAERTVADLSENGPSDPDRDRVDGFDRPGEEETSHPDVPAFGEPGTWFRQLFESAPVPIVVFTGERGIVYCNRAAVDLVGATGKGKVRGEDPVRFVHPDHRGRARRRIRRVLEDRQATEPTEYRLAGLDGEERSAEIAAAPLTYDGEPGAYVVINDVTPYERTRARFRRERRFVETVVDAIDDIVYVLDEDGSSHFWNERLVETSGYSHEEIESMHAKDFLPEDQHRHVPGLLRAIDSFDDQRVELDLLTKDGDEIPHEFKGTTFEDPETGVVYRCGVARDISDRLERERRLERQRDELATLDRINRVLLETTRDLVRTANREVIERTICSQLVDSDLYEFAWIAERAFDGDHLVTRTTAGDDRGYLDAIRARTDASGVVGGPADRAIRTGDVQVVDGSGSGPWVDAASESGFGSIAAVPLHHDGTSYGVLLLHTVRESAFRDRVREDFDVFGRTVGFVINAVRSRDLLFSDAVVELELRLSGDGTLFATLASDRDCELELEGYVAQGRRWVLYLDVRDGSPEDVVTLANDDPGVERARVVGSSDGDSRIELVVTDPAVLTDARNVGASIQSLVADPRGLQIVVEVPVDSDVREILEPIRREFPDMRLEARRDRDREVTTASHPGGLLEGLTGRQREVLEAAYRAGYFAWPRDSTADEVAESLDLASATLHGHLRKAEAAILSTLFDGA